jgi:hypothetical protein
LEKSYGVTTASDTVSQSSFVIASDRRERGNLLIPMHYEIASVVSLSRNDITTQSQLDWLPSGA